MEKVENLLKIVKRFLHFQESLSSQEMFLAV